MALRLCVLVGLLVGICPVLAQEDAEAPEVNTVRLLTVGNSFAQNSTRYLNDIVKASGKHELVLGKANLGGCSLERHWRHAAQHENDPNDAQGKPYGGRSLKQILQSDKWDVVTLQQYSWISNDIETYRPYAANLHALVKANAPQADVRFHQTWAYRADDTGRIKPDYPQEKMHADIRAAYHTIAGELDMTIIPVGEAFANARKHPDSQFKPDDTYDFENPEYPKLPNQKHSLCAGYRWRKQKDGTWKLGLDTHHANTAGEYLGAAVFYECLFGESVIGNEFVPSGMSKEDVAFLQRIAHETVQDRQNIEPDVAGPTEGE